MLDELDEDGVAEVEDRFDDDELDDDVEFVDDDVELSVLVGVDGFVELRAALAIGLAAMAPTSPVKATPVRAPATRRARAAG